jgi:hypothetical protein
MCSGVAVLGGACEPLERVHADRLGVAERAQRLARDDRLELRDAQPHRPQLQQLEQARHPAGVERLAVARELRDRHDRRAAAEPERVEPRPHRARVGVTQAEHQLRLRGRRLDGDEVDRGYQIDGRAAGRRQIPSQGLGCLPVPADNQYTGAGEGVVIHTRP